MEAAFNFLVAGHNDRRSNTVPCHVDLWRQEALLLGADYEEEVVEQLYEDLENTIKRVSKKDLLIVMGDWNAKVGEYAYDQWTGTVGRFGLGEANDHGFRLLEFASSHKLTLASTLFPHKISSRTTWHSPDGKELQH
ncbi:hypothetical protein ACOMHN_058782 [Nucella lapillus]